MCAVSYGTPVRGRLVPVSEPELSVKMALPGELYQVEIQTSGVPDPQGALETLISELDNRFGAKTVYAYADSERILLQLYGSPFAWSALIPFLPLILGGIGIVVTFISVWFIFSGIPSWAWGLLAIGIVTLFLFPAILTWGKPKGGL
jgi:hypothetical protein